MSRRLSGKCVKTLKNYFFPGREFKRHCDMMDNFYSEFFIDSSMLEGKRNGLKLMKRIYETSHFCANLALMVGIYGFFNWDEHYFPIALFSVLAGESFRNWGKTLGRVYSELFESIRDDVINRERKKLIERRKDSRSHWKGDLIDWESDD